MKVLGFSRQQGCEQHGVSTGCVCVCVCMQDTQPGAPRAAAAVKLVSCVGRQFVARGGGTSRSEPSRSLPDMRGKPQSPPDEGEVASKAPGELNPGAEIPFGRVTCSTAREHGHVHFGVCVSYVSCAPCAANAGARRAAAWAGAAVGRRRAWGVRRRRAGL